MKQSKSADLCISVFKNGEHTTNKKEFTKMWIQLINQVEKGKRTNWGAK